MKIKFLFFKIYIFLSCISLNAQWAQIGSDINGSSDGIYFGRSISLNADGTIVAIGAAHVLNNNTLGPGYAGVYQNTGSAWVQIGSNIFGENDGDSAGISVNLSST